MTEQIQSVASIDDFEANRAKTKKALPALLIVFTLGTLMIQAFNLVFQNIGDSLGMSSSASLISTLPGIVLGVVLKPGTAAAGSDLTPADPYAVGTWWNWNNPKSRHYRADFPKPVKIAANATGWLESEISDYIKKLSEKRG